jgi:hypothetical protein
MTDLHEREARYRRLSGRLTPDEARHLIDRLQVLALTRPDTVRELETFFERDGGRSASSPAAGPSEDQPRGRSGDDPRVPSEDHPRV